MNYMVEEMRELLKELSYWTDKVRAFAILVLLDANVMLGECFSIEPMYLSYSSMFINSIRITFTNLIKKKKHLLIL